MVKDWKNGIAEKIFSKTRPRGLDFGLELTYILLWIERTVKKPEARLPVALSLFRRVMRRMSTDEMIRMKRPMVEAEELEDPYERQRNLFELRESFKQLVDGQITIEELVAADRRVKHRAVRKFQAMRERKEMEDGF